eukprot:9467142-Pyramimonas_sp.AAC.2
MRKRRPYCRPTPLSAVGPLGRRGASWEPLGPSRCDIGGPLGPSSSSGSPTRGAGLDWGRGG